MGLFSILTDKVRQIDDFILADMINENEENLEQSLSFNQHLYATKYWFLTISWANKKRFLFALLKDLKSAWTLAYTLKSIWNCRPKDSVMSASEKEHFSSYDKVPLDYNRTAQPIEALVEVMRAEREWFFTLNPSCQFLVLAELLTLSGGPIMWEVQRKAQSIYEEHRTQLLLHLQESVVVSELSGEKVKNIPVRKNSATAAIKSETPQSPHTGHASIELEMHLASWKNTIKQIKDNLKLEEIEITFTDSTTYKIWKVNRPKPEGIETVDYIQWLPSKIAMRILSYLPRAQLGDYAKVNAYWSYLIDEFKAEINARTKINMDLERLKEIMMRHDMSQDVLGYVEIAPSSKSMASIEKKFQASIKQQSEKSGAGLSFKHLLQKHPKKLFVHRPVNKMSDLSDRLNQRGSVDENVWLWCRSVLNRQNLTLMPAKENKNIDSGVINLGNNHFPCPLMKKNLKVPLEYPLVKDPTTSFTVSRTKKKCIITEMNIPTVLKVKQRYSLWTKDFSGLYPVFKLSSYESPI